MEHTALQLLRKPAFDAANIVREVNREANRTSAPATLSPLQDLVENKLTIPGVDSALWWATKRNMTKVVRLMKKRLEWRYGVGVYT